MNRHALMSGVVLLTFLVVGCRSGQAIIPTVTEVANSEICPTLATPSDAIYTAAASGTPVAYSRPPKTYATAHGVSVEMTLGESEWCGVVSDVFHVVTSDVPLTVHPGETVTIPNPLPDQRIYEAGVGFTEASTPPTAVAGRLTWPFAGSHGPGHDLSFDTKGLTFSAETKPGRYVLSVWLSFAARRDMFASSNREANYALLLDVTE